MQNKTAAKDLIEFKEVFTPLLISKMLLLKFEIEILTFFH